MWDQIFLIVSYDYWFIRQDFSINIDEKGCNVYEDIFAYFSEFSVLNFQIITYIGAL